MDQYCEDNRQQSTLEEPEETNDGNKVENEFTKVLLDMQNNNDENLKCFDCGAADPEWTSVNNGIYICYQCSRIHTSFGAQISYVKSIKLDTWSQKQVHIMFLGGNEEFREYL